LSVRNAVNRDFFAFLDRYLGKNPAKEKAQETL
jgi:hypothetical protein